MTLDNLELLRVALISETCDRSGHSERQGEVHMSWLSLPKDEILARVRNGHDVGYEQKLKFYQGTLAERGMRERLESICRNHHAILGTWIGPTEIRAYGGRLLGNIDGSIGETLIEIKTVPNENILSEMRVRGKLPVRVYRQTQAYLLWGKFSSGVVIYESRADGATWLVPVWPNTRVQDELTKTAEEVIIELYGRDAFNVQP